MYCTRTTNKVWNSRQTKDFIKISGFITQIRSIYN